MDVQGWISSVPIVLKSPDHDSSGSALEALLSFPIPYQHAPITVAAAYRLVEQLEEE